ncbi:MAG: foldase protein PrsA [Acidobacteriota bacterium]|jgi:parvulin-like peptidyl-prolyl isomerase|nr:foldase protein PrsA [Acidobacteriota bacterium]
MLHFVRQRAQKLYVLLLSAALLLSAGCGSTSSQSSNQANTNSLPPVVATVADRPISTRLYEMYLKNGREELGLDPNTEEGRKKLEQLREGIVAELIDRTLVAQEAERRGLSIPTEQMAKAEQRAIEEFGGDQKYDTYLAQHKLTRDEYRDVIKMEIYGDLLRQDLSKGLSVTDEEIQKYYEAHKTEQPFQLPERVTASHILIAARPNVISQQLQQEKNIAGDELKAAANAEMARRRKMAEELRRKAASGADFAALARQSSEDPSSRDKGGDLGTFPRETHTRAFDTAAFAVKPGSLSDVVQSDFGFHIIKVKAHEQARAMTLIEAREEIRSRLMGEREATRLTDWLKEARRKAKIHINEPFRFGALKTDFPN